MESTNHNAVQIEQIPVLAEFPREMGGCGAVGGGRVRIRPWGGSGWRKGFGKKNGHWLETWGKLHSTMG